VVFLLYFYYVKEIKDIRVMDKLEKYTETNKTMIEDCKDIFDRLELETKQGQGGNGEPGDDPDLPNAKPVDEGEAGEPGAPTETKDDTLEPELTDKELKKLSDALGKQKKFIDGDTRKTKLNKKDEKLIKAVGDSNASVEKVESQSRYGSGTNSTDVVVIRRINEKSKGICDMFCDWSSTTSQEAVKEGMTLGTMLGRKLKIRNDDITTQVNRQRKGKVDKRLLAEFGVGNTKLFENTYTTTTNDCGIHISIDASGSMGGTRWRNALKTAVAIAKAADLVGGIRVRIDVRSIDSCDLHPGRGYGATVVIAYDSKVNKLQHIRKFFPFLRTSGGTPEGLCFEAIMDIIQEGGSNTDRYFINMSDGSPSQEYVSLTKDAITKMKRNGMKVLSYYIAESTQRNTTFDTMYGDSASYVDTKNVAQIAKTLNKLLAQR